MINLMSLNASDTPMQKHTINGRECWIPAEPCCEPFTWRLRDALAVLRGEAHALRWPDEEHDGSRPG